MDVNKKDTWLRLLVDGALTLGIQLSPAQELQLFTLCELLIKWNKTYNLTALKTPSEILCHHILDSLSIAGYIPSGCHLDVGTGPGFPTLPLAIVFPEQKFTALDCNGKKIRFIKQAVQTLGLNNIVAEQSRIEDFVHKTDYQSIMSRAFSELSVFANHCLPLMSQDTLLLAMKGAYPKSEMDALPEHVTISGIHQLKVPGLEAERHLVICQRERD